MDKENLYYIIQEGTNQRATMFSTLNKVSDVLVCEKKAIPIELEWYKINSPKRKYISISIREYEDKFTEKEPEVKKEPASYNLYSTGKHVLGLYNNKVIVLNQDGGIVERILSDENTVLRIREYLHDLRMFKHEGLNSVTIRRAHDTNELLEELIESAT